MSDMSWQVVSNQDFLRGWIPKYQGIQPRRKFYTRSQHLCLTGLGDVSRLSSGLDPQISRDPTPKKVLYAKSAPMPDRSWRRVKTFFGVGSPNSRDPTPKKVLYAKSLPMSDMSWQVVSRLSSGLNPVRLRIVWMQKD